MKKSQGLMGLAALFFVLSTTLLANEPTLITRPQGRTLDGVTIEAVEAYPRIKQNQFNLGLGVYPFDSYYDGLSVNAGFTYHFDDDLGWELINASYFFSFQKGLTAQLAEIGRVQPQKIYRLQYIVTSNALYTPALGKFVFSKKYIRYFRFSFIGGIGVLSASQENQYSDMKFAANLGARWSMTINDAFSFGLEVRDAVAVTEFDNFVTFGLTSGYNF